MRKQPICGYMDKSVDNLSGTVFTSLTTICSLIQKIVTKTEILALVWMVLGTYFRRYSPIIGYMKKIVDNLKWLLFTYLATIYDFNHEIVTRTEILALVSLLSGTYFK